MPAPSRSPTGGILAPYSLALDIDVAALDCNRLFRATFHPAFVIGVSLGDHATAFPNGRAAEEKIINDAVGPHPVAVYVNDADRSVRVHLRQVGDRVLTFEVRDGQVRDRETGSIWRMETGLAFEGPLQGKSLRVVPHVPAFPDAWRDFFPHSRWYGGT